MLSADECRRKADDLEGKAATAAEPLHTELKDIAQRWRRLSVEIEAQEAMLRGLKDWAPDAPHH